MTLERVTKPAEARGARATDILLDGLFTGMIGALAVAPLGFDAVTPTVVAWPAKIMFIVLLGAGVVFAGLAVLWGRRWKLTVR